MNERVEVALVEGPLPSEAANRFSGAGAVVTFEGVVRPAEGEAPIAALHYEAYEPMTTRELRRLAEQTLLKHGLIAIRVVHSVGRVRPGEASFRLAVQSAHRKEALRATDGFIRTMKQQVPLWKVAQWS